MAGEIALNLPILPCIIRWRYSSNSFYRVEKIQLVYTNVAHPLLAGANRTYKPDR
jgi:hypothetical protein